MQDVLLKDAGGSSLMQPGMNYFTSKTINFAYKQGFVYSGVLFI